MSATDYLTYDILDLEQIVVLSIIICFPKILSIVLTVPVVQYKLQNVIFFKCQRYNEISTIMLNELGNYCVPDLNTVLFCMPTSDFNTYHRIMITVQKYISDIKRFER